MASVTEDADASAVSGDRDRRSDVLETALTTFARYGYRKTSMDQVARDAHISRPGLYFLFASKQALFREAVERSLQQDLVAVDRALAEPGDSLRLRLLHAFDHWAGRYVGPLAHDVAAVIEDNPDLQGPVAQAAPDRFASMVVAALAEQIGRTAAKRVGETLISTSIGIKHQVDDRDAYRRRMKVGIDLLIAPPSG